MLSALNVKFILGFLLVVLQEDTKFIAPKNALLKAATKDLLEIALVVVKNL